MDESKREDDGQQSVHRKKHMFFLQDSEKTKEEKELLRRWEICYDRSKFETKT